MSACPTREDVSVLIPAAGSGERMGRGPKAMLPLHGRPVIDWIVDKAVQLGVEVLVATSSGVQVPGAARGVPGGATRQESIERLAAAATRPWCLLWDATNPFASLPLARAALAAAQATGAAVPVVGAHVPWLEVSGDRVQAARPTAAGGTVGMPHAYATQVLRDVTTRAAREGWTAASTIELMLLAGQPVAAIPGEKLNIKITTAEDWVLAGALQHLLSS